MLLGDRSKTLVKVAFINAKRRALGALEILGLCKGLEKKYHRYFSEN